EKMTIRHRLWAIAGLFVTGTLILGATHQWSANKVDSIDKKAAYASSHMEDLDGLSSDVVMLKGLVSNYVDGRVEAGPLVSETILHAQAEAVKLAGAIRDTELRSKADKVTGQLGGLNAAWQQLVKINSAMGLSEKEGVRGVLRDAVHQVEAMVSKAGEKDLMVSMLMLRRHEKDFMLRGADKYVQKWQDESKSFERALHDSGLSALVKAGIGDAMGAYEQGFTNYADMHQQLHAALSVFQAQLANDLIPAVDAFDAGMGGQIDGYRKESTAIHSAITWTYWSALLVILAIAVALLLWIVSSIVKPLSRVADAMDRLDDGDVGADLSDVRMAGIINDLVVSYDKLKKTVQKSYMLGQVTELLPHAIMMADQKTLTIQYLNPAAQSLFKTMENFLPCRSEELVGQCIDIFHKNPAHQRKFLADKANLPATANFRADEKHIRFSAYAVDNTQGEWEQIMVAWQDVTEEVELASAFESHIGGMVQELITSSGQVQASSETLSS
ncbi:MAG: PAS domain-containing protein, partial [Mariprofundaceae bacterium]|nr:PAS domain-containing protein [Mariprofundaceae bacterium]